MKFLITLTQDEDRMWAECPSIPGCVSQGQSRNQTIENVREAIAACFSPCDTGGKHRQRGCGRGRIGQPGQPLWRHFIAMAFQRNRV
jgi:hypothetical protein